MSCSKEFLIEIGSIKRIMGTEESLVTEVFGLVPSIPGKYPIRPGMEVEVCPVIRRFHCSNMQKVIFTKDGSRRRMALIHHNAAGPVIQNVNSTGSLTFGINRQGATR